jgi:hypothetical protein
VHNRAVTRCLRLARLRAATDETDWPARLAKAGVILAAAVPEWTALGFDTLQPTDELAVTGENPLGQREGLGVPVVAHRKLKEAELAIWKPYGPREAVFAATAVIQPRGTVTRWRGQPVELVLHDPLREDTLNLGGRPLSLACDLTTPMVRRLAQGPMRNYKYLGVFDPAFYAARAGVYAVDPYQPGKVPVVLVQGLWSSPKVWVRMLDTLRADPVLRASYQFWVVLYPSGYPLPLAAAWLRRSLRENRRGLDPQEIDPALDQMVILGKSTGGQVVRMLVQPSGETLWNAIFARPIDQVHAPPELRNELAEMFFYRPEPSIRRVIFVATGHRGTIPTRQPGIRLGVELMRWHNPLHQAWAELEAGNGRAVFQPFFQDRTLNSLDGMQAGNPLLVALDAQPIAPGVVYHSIIANVHPGLTQEKMTDGFVRYSSAHLGGAASEQIVTASHFCEADPELIAEMRRILLVDLAERNSATAWPPRSQSIRLEVSSNAAVSSIPVSIGGDGRTQ